MKKTRKTIRQKIVEYGAVAALNVQRRRERDPKDFLSVGKRQTKQQAAVGFETAGQRAKSNLALRQKQTKGELGGGATAPLEKRKLGITASTEMGWANKLVEMITEAKTPTPKKRPSVETKFKQIKNRAEQHLSDISNKKEQGLSIADRSRSAIEALSMLKHTKPEKARPHWRS